MKSILSLFAACFLTLSTFAQFGINAGYKSLNAPDWDDQTPNDFVSDGFKVGLDYWFRLKNYRVEFTPEISYSQFESSHDLGVADGQLSTYNLRFIGLHANTNIYVFDFEGDCDCPTWKKDGGIFQKGFFLQVSPGISRVETEFENSFSGDQSQSETIFSLGIGAGLDIGVHPIVTITPLVNFHRYFDLNWENLFNSLSATDNFETENSSSINQWFLGLKVGIRLDER